MESLTPSLVFRVVVHGDCNRKPFISYKLNRKTKTMKSEFLLRLIVSIAMMSLVIPFTGCSRGPATGTVSGKVMYGDTPLTLGKIVFVNQEKGTGGSAVLDENGHYQVTGNLPIGEHKVYFANGMKSGSMDPKDLILTPVKQKYKASSTSGLTFEIKTGENIADFNLEK